MEEKKIPTVDHDQAHINMDTGMPDFEAYYQAGFSNGHDTGYERGKREAKQGVAWVKGAPKEQKQCFGKVQSVLYDDKTYDAVIYPITDSDHWWAVGKDFKFSVHKDKIVAHLDESGTAAAGREDDGKAQFDALQNWLSGGGYSFDGEYYYDDENNFFTPDQIWEKFKQQKEK